MSDNKLTTKMLRAMGLARQDGSSRAMCVSKCITQALLAGRATLSDKRAGKSD